MENSNEQFEANGKELKIEDTQQPGLLRQMYRDAVSVLTDPSEFYSNRFETLTRNHAIALGLVVSWLAAFADWIVRALKHESLMNEIKKIQNQLQGLPIWKDIPESIWNQGEIMQSFLPEWVMEGLRMLLNPFHNLFMYYTSGFVFWLGASLLVQKNNPFRKNVHYQNLVKIAAISSVSSIVGGILGFLPAGLGGFVGWIYHVVLLMTGFSVQFNISKLRSLSVIFLPSLIGFMMALLIIGLVVGLMVAIVSSLFH
jgi:hypothetical protein